MDKNKREYIDRLLTFYKSYMQIYNNCLSPQLDDEWLQESLEILIDNDEINKVIHEILDELGVPKDNYNSKLPSSRNYNSELPEFCRDCYYDLFHEFHSTEMTNDKFIKKVQETETP